MSTNRYLEKIAGILDKAISFGENVAGIPYRNLAHEAAILSKAEAQKRTAKQAFEEAAIAKANTSRSRLQAGLGAVGIVGTGFLGAHKYRQHKDEEILRRIDSIYQQGPK